MSIKTQHKMRGTIIQAIHKEHAENILSGKKTLELRKGAPSGDFPYTVYLYETKNSGGLGLVVGLYTCKGKIRLKYPSSLDDSQAYKLLEDYAKRACISVERLLAYADGGEIVAWIISEPIRFRKPRPLDIFGLKNPPQSWQYLK